jgi:hypothetical protein
MPTQNTSRYRLKVGHRIAPVDHRRTGRSNTYLAEMQGFEPAPPKGSKGKRRGK